MLILSDGEKDGASLERFPAAKYDSLENAACAFQPVDPLLPVLATYLGHVHVHDTYWYLEAVPELLQLATERLTDGGKR